MSLDAWRGIRAWGPKNAPPDAVFENAPQRAHAIPPVDFLPLGTGAPVVGDGDLVDACARAGDLGDDLRFEAEAILLDKYRLNQLALEDFVAGLHVREVEIGRHVR